MIAFILKMNLNGIVFMLCFQLASQHFSQAANNQLCKVECWPDENHFK